jgi:hypothetical protein
MTDLTEKTITLLKKASDFAAAAYDSDLTEVEIDGAKVSAISLELQLRTLASKLERSRQKQAGHSGPSFSTAMS